MPTISPTILHWITLIGSTFAGAVVANLSQNGNVFEALLDPTKRGAIIGGAVIAGLAALLALAQRSFLPAVSRKAVEQNEVAESSRSPKVPKSPMFPVFMIALALCLFSCTPATAPIWTSIEQTVLTDLENGVALETIESAVIAIDPSLAGVAGLVDTVIQDAINYLVDTGALPTTAKPAASKIQAQIASKLEAGKR